MIITSVHRGVEYVISKDAEPGYFKFEFVFNGQAVVGRRETRLPQLADRKVQTEIDRRYREIGERAPRPRKSA